MILAQKAVVKQGDKFLILHRASDEKAFPGLWDFPGGKLEQGEEPLESLKREVREETQLEIEPGEVLETYYGEVKPGISVEFKLYATRNYSGKVTIGNEHSEFKWATKEEILALQVMPLMAAFIAGTH